MKSSVLLATVLFVTASALAMSAGAQTTPMPPCEATPPPGPQRPLPPRNLRILSGPGAFEALTDTQEVTSGPHAYYFALASRPDCFRAFSLRSQAQIEQHRRSPDVQSPGVTYDPANDADSRRQDAAKIVIRANSLGTQVWLPVGVKFPGRYFFVWDAWFGAEFAYANTLIDNYKMFQFGSPRDEIWNEVKYNWKGAAAAGLPDLARIIGRLYGSGSGSAGPNVDLGSSALSPQVGRFTVKAETWTRHFVLFETDADGWDTYTHWVADETQEPVLLFDRLQLGPRERRIGIFRLEYNTSTSGRPEGRVPLVGYARNVVVLETAADVLPLLQKPVR